MQTKRKLDLVFSQTQQTSELRNSYEQLNQSR